MKKIIVFLAIAATFAAPAIAQTSSAIDALINDYDFKGAVIETVNELVVDAAAAVAANAAWVVVDTNANVDVLTKVPALVGQTLITPNSTNVWTDAAVGATNSYLLRVSVAFGLTTNDWAKVATDK